MNTNKLTRKFLVERLAELLSDEFDANEIVYETDEEIIIRIIQAAQYYRDAAQED
jgi:hypothetical protein